MSIRNSSTGKSTISQSRLQSLLPNRLNGAHDQLQFIGAVPRHRRGAGKPLRQPGGSAGRSCSHRPVVTAALPFAVTYAIAEVRVTLADG